MPPSGSHFGGPFKRVNDTLVSTLPVVAPNLGSNRERIAPRRGFGTYWIDIDTLPANQTAVMRLQAPAGVVGAYFYIGHYGPSPADVVKAGVRAAASSAEDTATTAFSPVTFGGAAGGIIPGWILGQYPPGDTNSVQFLKSDYVSVTPIARTDFPKREPLFDFAFKCGARGVSGGAFSTTDNENTPWVLGWANTENDILTTPSATTMYPYIGNRVWVEWVYSGERRPVAAAWGDSIFDGLSASNTVDGYLQNSFYSAGVELYSNSVGGRTSFDTWDAMRRELLGIASKIDAVVLAAWTPNDEVNGYSAASVWQRFLVEKSWVESLGLQCLIMGPMPFNGSAVPAVIRSNLISSGFQFFDAGIIVATSSTLLEWTPEYTSDNVHPNDTGYNLLTTKLRPWITTRLCPWDLPLYESYTNLPIPGPSLGKRALVKRIGGTNVGSVGYFQVEWNGSRWEVRPGESVVADNSEQSYTSVGTSIVSLKSANIPADLIGDGELWEASMQTTQISGTFDTYNAHKLRLGGGEIWSSTTAVSAVPTTYEVWPRRFRRSGSTYERYTSSLTDSFTADAPSLPVNLGVDQSLDCSIIPAAINNVYRIRRLLLRRVG